MTLAQLIRNNRMKLGISQSGLAERLGVSQAAIGQWEREVTAPRSKYFPELAKIFDIDVALIVAAADEMEAYQKGRADSEARRVSRGEAPRAGGSSRLKIGREHPTFGHGYGYGPAPTGHHADECRRFDEELVQLLSMMGSPGALNVRIGVSVADYASQKSIVEIKHLIGPGMIKTLILQSLWALTILRAMTDGDENFITIIRLPAVREGDEDQAKGIQRMKAMVSKYSFEASLVGMHVIAVDSAEEAAKSIIKIEQENAFEYDFEDDE